MRTEICGCLAAGFWYTQAYSRLCKVKCAMARCQKEKNKYGILTHTRGVEKDGTDDLFAGRQWRRTQRTDSWAQGSVRGRDESRDWCWNVHMTMCNHGLSVETCRVMRGTQTWCSVTTQGGVMGWEGSSRGRVSTYGSFMLLYGRSRHSTVKQLSTN